jgi:ferrous-iron efflux pump FieF
MTVQQVHNVMDEIEDKLLAEFPGVEILIHPDPEGLINETGIAAVDLLADIESAHDRAS